MRVRDIRSLLVADYLEKPFQPMIEIKGASFLADEPAIIGEPDEAYIASEIEWYESQSLNIGDIPGGPPLMWRRTANEDGQINSNYGWVLWSQANGDQYGNVAAELRRDYASRRAVAIYTRPTMHTDQKLGGSGQDFMCTNAVSYSIDPDLSTLDVVVQMRSNDVVFGYRNDFAWQTYARDHLLEDLRTTYPSLTAGSIVWQAMSLHVYPRHYKLLRKAAALDVPQYDWRAAHRDAVRAAEGLRVLDFTRPASGSEDYAVRDGDVA